MGKHQTITSTNIQRFHTIFTKILQVSTTRGDRDGVGRSSTNTVRVFTITVVVAVIRTMMYNIVVTTNDETSSTMNRL